MKTFICSIGSGGTRLIEVLDGLIEALDTDGVNHEEPTLADFNTDLTMEISKHLSEDLINTESDLSWSDGYSISLDDIKIKVAENVNDTVLIFNDYLNGNSAEALVACLRQKATDFIYETLLYQEELPRGYYIHNFKYLMDEYNGSYDED